MMVEKVKNALTLDTIIHIITLAGIVIAAYYAVGAERSLMEQRLAVISERVDAIAGQVESDRVQSQERLRFLENSDTRMDERFLSIIASLARIEKELEGRQ